MFISLNKARQAISATLIAGLILTSITYADGMLYTLSIDGVMGLVRPTPEGHELVSSFEIPKGGKGKSWAHPVVCGGRL